MATEVGVGYVRLLPSMREFSSEAAKGLKAGLSAPATAAGKDAGKKLSAGVEAGVDRSAFGSSGQDAGRSFSDGVESGVSKVGSSMESAGSTAGDLFSSGFDMNSIADSAVSVFSGLSGKLGTAAAGAGLAAGGALAVGVMNGFEVEASTDRLAAQLGGGEWAESMGDIAGNLYGDAFGESIAETGDAVRRTIRHRLVPEDATDAAIEAMTTKFLTFTDVMEQDIDMAGQAVSRMLRSGIADDGAEAFDILTAGIQQGADSAGDLLETFQEYSGQFSQLGLSAEDATGLMIQGLDAGARDADKVADALKEVAIRGQSVAEGSIEAGRGFELLGFNAEDMSSRLAQGGPAAREALDMILDGLQGIEDPALRNEAALELFGTQAEDMQDALFALDLDTAAQRLGDHGGATDDLSSAYDNASTKIESFRRQALQKLTVFVGEQVLPKLQALSNWAQRNPEVFKGLAVVIGGVLTAAFVGWAAGVVRSTLSAAASFGRGVASITRGALRMGSAVGRGGSAVVRGLGRFSTGFRNAQAAESAFSGRLGTLGGKLRALPGSIGRVATSFGRLATQAGRAATQVVAAGARMAASAAKTTARVVAQIGVQIARWVVLGVQSLLHAAKVALAWLISLGPIGLVVAAVIGAVALIVSNWDKISAAAAVVWEWIKTNWPTLLAVLTGPFGIAVLVIVKHKDKILGAIRSAINWVKTNWPLLLAVLTGPFGIAVLVIKRNFETIKRWATNAKNWITGRFNSLVSFVRRLPGRISSAASGMFNGIKNAFRDALNAVIGWWNGLSFTLPTIDIPSVSVAGREIFGGASVGGQTFSTPNIPMLARGGIATDATLAMIGEGGQDEAVLPLDTFWSRLSAGFGEVADTSATGLGALRGQLTALLGAVRLQTSLITASQRANTSRLIDWFKENIAGHIRMMRAFLDWTKNGIATLIEIEQFGARNVRVFEDLSGVPRMASGGIARYRPGGLMVNVAEQDDEAIAPLSDLRSMVVDSALLAAARMPSGPGAAPAAVVTLDVTGGDDDLVKLIASWVRKKGRGDPVASLGGSR